MRTVLFVFGTRPEAIKLAPVIEAVRSLPHLAPHVCVTAQHRDLLDEILKVFAITPDYDLNIMRRDQSICDITIRSLARLKGVFEEERPDLVVVQGDTTTSFVAALAAYYFHIPIAHVEAGLRTGRKYEPFPEEINRRLTDHMADLHFAPTQQAQANLLAEGIPSDQIFVTGNTVVDALNFMLPLARQTSNGGGLGTNGRRVILVTAHRRENFSGGIASICRAILTLVQRNADIEVIFPVHPNPQVVNTVRLMIGQGVERIHLQKPKDYLEFLGLMDLSYLILSDSGGIQEEAPSLRKPVLILREVTERPEVVEAGFAKVVGTDQQRIVDEAQRLLDDSQAYLRMTSGGNPFGDGRASERIAAAICQFLD